MAANTIHSHSPLAPAHDCIYINNIPITPRLFLPHEDSNSTNNSYTIVDWNPYRIPFDSDYHCSLPISVECTFVFHRFCFIYAAFVISCPSYLPPISLVSMLMCRRTMHLVLVQPSALSKLATAPEASRAITPASLRVYQSIVMLVDSSPILV